MKKIIKAFHNPLWAIQRANQKYIAIPKYNRKHIKSLQLLLTENGYDFEDYEKIIQEFHGSSEIHDYVNKQFSNSGIKHSFPPDRYGWGSLLYFIIRKTKPGKIVETGCWYGNSSTIILAALRENNLGRLYTIDLPALFETGGYYDENPYLNEELRTSSLPEGRMPGFIVPDFLEERWQLIFGSSSKELPSLLESLNEIDIFLHDSLHSTENMDFEFKIAYKYLKKNGILASDNIDWNNVFEEFSKYKRSFSYLAYYESALLKHNFGMIIKE